MVHPTAWEQKPDKTDVGTAMMLIALAKLLAGQVVTIVIQPITVSAIFLIMRPKTYAPVFPKARAKIKGSAITTEPFTNLLKLDPAVKICYNTFWFGQ